MLIALIRIGIDFGLVVLIWMIQLIVYPGFLYYPVKNLIVWHGRYTTLIGRIVGPLMLVQFVLAIYRTITVPILYHIVDLSLIVMVWGVTFVQFVPRHRAISSGTVDEGLLTGLVRKNWARTLFWTLVFLSSVAYQVHLYYG